MLFRYSARELLHHPLRTTLAVAGVSVATAMLLDMLMLGAGLQRSFKGLLASRGYELRVSPKGTLPFDTEATLASADRLRDSLAARPEVAGVAPVLAANLLAGPPGRQIRLFVLGIRPEEQGVLQLVQGEAADAGDELVVSGEAARAVGVGPGDTLRLSTPGALGAAESGTRSFRVTGRAEFVYASREERPVATDIDAVRALTGRPDRASFFMVRLVDGVAADSAAARLADAFPRVEVASVAQLVDRARERLSYFRQLALILGTVSLVVTGLLVGTIMAVSVSERYGTIAALRAVGVSRGHVVGALALESLLLCAVAGVVGLGLGMVTARYLETILADFPGLPRAVRFFVLRPVDVVRGYGGVLAVGVLAALAPAWRATGLDIATTLHREEP